MKNKLFQMYEENNCGVNNFCLNCRKESSIKNNALGPWLIQDGKTETGIVFIGKVARGDNLGTIINGIEDVTEFGDDMIRYSSWAYWKYTREIIKKLYADLEKGLLDITFTNIVKCNNSMQNDTTMSSTKRYCITENRFIWKEIDIINPLIIIFYTNYQYDEYINQIFATKCSNVQRCL